MEVFEPQPVYVIDEPEQVKAFTDPLRARVLRLLAAQAMTNQQLADTLGEPHAKVLYHVRFLLDIGLILLVDTQIKGGNVEKYYRAIARVFDIRATAEADEETNLAVATSLLENLRHDFLASVVAYPDVDSYIHNAAGWLPDERVGEFNQRLRALIAEYFVPGDPPDDPAMHKYRTAALIYREAPENREK
jgi:DNA-binding transcriptional ArsR family regulator